MTKPEQNEGDRSRDQLLAGEYVLGVLSAADRARVEARIAKDSSFAAMVANWQTNLAGFNDDYAEEAPPAWVYEKIERRLFAPAFAPQSAGRWWDSLFLWRGLAFGSLALLISFVSLQSGWIAGQKPSPPSLVARMSGENGAALSLLAQYDAGNGRLQLVPVAAVPTTKSSLELWVIPDAGSNPISLGVLPQTGDNAIQIPENLRPRLKDGVTFAVSVEPFGGSPTGQPTGPVIVSGQATNL